jgi:outer membrane immunogenic protein
MLKLSIAALGSAVLALGSISAASAADLAVKAPVLKAPPAPVVMPYNWNGFYVGGHVGYGWGDKDWSNTDAAGFPAGALGSDHPAGFLGGGQAGFNWVFSPQWLVGIEGQVSWTDADDSHVFPGVTARFSSKVDTLGTIAARLGYIWNNNWLWYVKGGAAFAHDKYHVSTTVPIVFNATTIPVGADLFSASETRWGWMIGAGVEWGFAPNWSAKVEYNFMDLGKERVAFGFAPPFPAGTVHFDIDQQIQVIKFGVNYHFTPWVVAKY